MKPVIVEFRRDVPATPGRRGFVRGERYAVASADAARALYPEAEIVSYEDGTPYEIPPGLSPAGDPDSPETPDDGDKTPEARRKR